MCGISGYFNSRLLHPPHLDKMTASLTHRGPEHTGKFSDERISLGHNRLKVLDLSDDANQPFTSADGRYILVYNGEVYNFRELQQELGIQTKTSSDTEVVLAAFVKLGDSFVEKLNGMFAIAIYDRESGKLKIWRDRVGIKPLYYYWDGTEFAFASELKALLTLPLTREIDRDALGDFMFLEYIPQPRTVFTNFYKLGNGCGLEFTNGKLRKFKYYDLLSKAKPNGEASFDDYLDQFSELLHSSLKYRTISDVPIGAFLSGGLDSSTVCAGLTELTSYLSTFNIGFEDAEYNESHHAQQVANELRTRHHSLTMKPDDLLEYSSLLFKHFDEPFAVASIFPTYAVSQMAKKKVTVALSGDGGDELFMGYGHYNWHGRLNYLDGLAGRFIRNTASFGLRFLPSRFERISKLLEYKSLTNDWPHVWSQEQYMFTENEIGKFTGTDYFNSGIRESWEKIRQSSNSDYQAISLFDFLNYLPDDLLYKIDMASMANSLEVRVPLLDHRLVEFAVNLPDQLKYKPHQQKFLLRKFLGKYLSNDLINRKKWGFGAPVDRWMKSSLKPMVQEVLGERELKKSGIFDPELVKQLLNRFDGGSHFEFKRIWALVIFQQWYRNHMVD